MLFLEDGRGTAVRLEDQAQVRLRDCGLRRRLNAKRERGVRRRIHQSRRLMGDLTDLAFGLRGWRCRMGVKGLNADQPQIGGQNNAGRYAPEELHRDLTYTTKSQVRQLGPSILGPLVRRYEHLRPLREGRTSGTLTHRIFRRSYA